MATETTTSSDVAGGFAGDPAEAFTPPAAGSCCGSTPTGRADSEAGGADSQLSPLPAAVRTASAKLPRPRQTAGARIRRSPGPQPRTLLAAANLVAARP